MSSPTVTTKEINDPPLPSPPCLPEDSTVGQLSSVGGFLGTTALALAKRSAEVATSLASSTSSAVASAATSAVGSAQSATQNAAGSLFSTGNQGVSLATHAFGQAYSAGEALVGAGLEMGSYVTSEAIASAVSSTQWLYDTSVATGERTVSIIADQFLGLIESAGTLLTDHVATPLGGTVVSAIDTLAGDSNAPASVHMKAARVVAGFLPITGGAKDIGKARELYRCAQALPQGEEKEAMLHQARRDCLIATASLSLDVISYFATGGAAHAVKTGSTALSALNFAKGAKENSSISRWIPKINIDLLSPQADMALSSPTIREAMEIILRYDPKPNDL